ncbi:MAG: oligosaccharide flippase family protein [Nitrospinota bacterium]
MKEQRLSKKIIKNILYTGLGQICSILLLILITPYMVSKLGIERYGIWVLIGAIINYLGLIDLGIGTAYVKHIAEYYIKKDYKEINRIVNTGILFYLILGVLILILLLKFDFIITNFFKFSREHKSDFLFVFYGVLIIFVLSSIFTIFRAVLNGLQRMDITNLISVAISVPRFAGIIIILSLGYGLRGLVIISLVIAILTGITQIYFCFRILPELRLNPLFFNYRSFKRLFNYGIKLQAVKLCELINLYADKILLGHFLGIGVVGFYELGAKIAMIPKLLGSILLPAITPASSELYALNNKKVLNELYVRGTRFLVLLVAPLATFVFVNASDIMAMWVGDHGYERSITAVHILIIGYSVHLLTGVLASIAKGMGIPQYEMRFSILVSIINIVLSTVLIIKIGCVGALIGTSLSMILGSIYFMSIIHKVIEQKTDFIMNTFLIPIITAIISSMPVYLLNNISYRFFIPAGRIDYLLIILVNGLLFFGFYLLIIKKIYITREDTLVFHDVMKILKLS